MNFKLFLILSIVLPGTFSEIAGQASTLQSRDYIILYPGIRQVDMDPFGHFYIVDENDHFLKLDTSGRLLHHVVNNNLGAIHSADVGNPFKIMVFYRDQQTIIMYDNTLSETQRIKLPEWDFHDITAACLAADNAIWLFDGLKNVLVKVDHLGKAVITSDPFDITHPASSRPDFIFDTDQYLVLKEVGKPISVFDDFGHHLNSLPVAEEFFSVYKDRLLRFEKSFIRLYHLPGGEEMFSYPYHEDQLSSRVLWHGNHFFIADEKGVFIVEAGSR